MIECEVFYGEECLKDLLPFKVHDVKKRQKQMNEREDCESNY